MKFSRVKAAVWTAVGCAVLLVSGYVISGCAMGNSGGTSSGMSKLTTTITDPAECSAAVGGNYQAVEVTITDVQANESSSTNPSSSKWVDLTPNMKPTQLNLLGNNASGGCFLAMLGDNLEVQAGNYKQIRLILGTNGKTMVAKNIDDTQDPTANSCANVTSQSDAVNCVEDSKGNWYALTTPSAEQTGVKIIPSQLSGGSLDLAAGQTEDLVINFQTCESILQAGNSGQYILQPVLNAGQVSTNSNTINGTVMDAAGNPVKDAIVSLEQPDSGTDRILYTTRTDTNGNFSFCSVLERQNTSGDFDVVVAAQEPTADETAVVMGVPLGSTTGTITLPATTFSTATLTGIASTQDASNNPVSTWMSFYPLEANPESGSPTTKYFTVPLLQTSANSSGYLPMETTAATYGNNVSCPTNTDCAAFSMTVPQSGITVYNYSSSGPTNAVASSPYGVYTVDAQAWKLNSNPVASDCSPSEMTTDQNTAITSANASTGSLSLSVNTTTPPLNFTGCS